MNDDFDQSKLLSLDLLPASDSGLQKILDSENSSRNFHKYLSLFLTAKNQELNNILMENPQLQDSIEIKALFLLNLLALKQSLKPYHISIRKLELTWTDSIAYSLVDLYKAIQKNIKVDNLTNLFNVNFYDYLPLLPTLVIYYSDFLLKDFYWQNIDNKATQKQILERVWTFIDDEKFFADLIDDNLVAQRYRLLALYYRRLDKSELAEKALTEYRQKYKLDSSKAIKLEKLTTGIAFQKEQMLDNLTSVYQAVSAVQNEIVDRAGIYRDTCFYYHCSDCCKKDFPTVSLTEFLHILQWIKSENIDIKPLIQRAQAIQETHKKLYGTELELVDQLASSKQDENPNNYSFQCPLLDDNDMCSIHTARPLACRSFGLSTINNQDVQACNYYLTQYRYNSSQRNEREVYDSRLETALLGASNNYLASKYNLNHMRQPVGTLVAWLTKFDLTCF